MKKRSNWKSADPENLGQQWWLFDLSKDPGETNNLLRADERKWISKYHSMKKIALTHAESIKVNKPKFLPEGGPICKNPQSKDFRKCWWRPGYFEKNRAF